MQWNWGTQQQRCFLLVFFFSSIMLHLSILRVGCATRLGGYNIYVRLFQVVIRTVFSRCWQIIIRPDQFAKFHVRIMGTMNHRSSWMESRFTCSRIGTKGGDVDNVNQETDAQTETLEIEIIGYTKICFYAIIYFVIRKYIAQIWWK